MFVQDFLKRVPGARSVVRNVREMAYRATGYREPTTGDHVRQTFGSGDVFFVQVGSNDGKHGDPIFDCAVDDPRWSGMLIEPVPYAFARLCDNYRNQDRFIFENVAISDACRTATFYYVSEEAKRNLKDLPEWFDQLGSFDRHHITKHLDGALTPYIQEAAIDCVPLNALLEKHDIGPIDLLHIDAEGHDWAILSGLDLERYRPRMIIFEYVHLNDSDLQKAERLLSGAGYLLRKCGLDVVATRAA